MSDAKEIYQAVLEECTKQIETIKNEYGNQLMEVIEDRLSKQYKDRIVALEKKNAELVKKVAKIEQQLNNQSMKDSYTTDNMKKNISISTDKIRIDGQIRYSAFEFNGWLYYANPRMGNFLYKVRTDGSGNQQLTDYSVDSYMKLSAKVKVGKLVFKDSEYRERTIDL